MRKLQLKRFETGLLVAAAILWIAPLVFYVKGVSFRRVMRQASGGNVNSVIATLGSSEGHVRRSHAGDSKFRQIQANEPITSLDTVTTGTQSSATLDLGEQASIAMGPLTMLRVSNDASSRNAIKVEFVAGSFSAKSGNRKVRVLAGGNELALEPNTSRRFEYSTEKPAGPDNPVKTSEALP